MALITKTHIIFHFSLISNQADIIVKKTAIRLTLLKLGHNKVMGPNCNSLTFSKNTCRANQTDKFNITPTTAAVIADNAPCNRG